MPINLAAKRRSHAAVVSCPRQCLLLLSSRVRFTRSPAGSPLSEGWTLQSSAVLKSTWCRAFISGCRPQPVAPDPVPNTVVGALVENGHFPDPYFGMNLRKIPGTTYPIGRAVHAAADAEGQPVQAVLVVSDGVRSAAFEQREEPSGSISTASTTARTSGSTDGGLQRPTTWSACSAATSSTSRRTCARQDRTCSPSK